MQKFVILLLLIFFPFTAGLCSENTKIEEKSTNNKEMVFLLPINVAAQQKITLSVTVPPSYRALQSMDAIVNNKNNLIEFIPKNDDENAWNEIITLNPLIGKSINASKMIDSIKASFFKEGQNVKVLEQQTSQEQGYEKSCIGMDYEFNRRHEIVYMCYYSGPYDCAGIQYAILWPKSSQQSALQLLENIKKFINEHSNVNL